MTVLYIPQTVSKSHRPLLPVVHVPPKKAFAALKDANDKVLGLSLLLDKQGMVEAVAFASPERAYYMALRSAQDQPQTPAKSFERVTPSNDQTAIDLLSDFLSLVQRTPITAFYMARLALLLYQSLGWHTCGVDISTLQVSPGRRPRSPAKFLAEKLSIPVNSRDIDQLWYDDEADKDKRMQRTCMRAWISAICADMFFDSVQKARWVDTRHLNAEELKWVGRMVLTTELLTAQKPLRMEGEFRAFEPGKEEGTVVIENARYKTRVRQSETTTVAFDTKDGKRVEGQAIGQKGKSTTVRLKGVIRGGISGVTVHGREELTNAEVASESFVLRLLQGDVAFGTVVNGMNERRSTFIDMIWFTPPRRQFNRVSSTKQTFNHVNTPLVKKLNGSQKEVAHAMLSDFRPLVIAHGPPGTGKTSTIAATVEYWITQRKPVWVIAQSNVAVKNIARSFIEKKVTAFKIIVSQEFYVEWHEHLYEEIQDRLIRSDDISQFKDAYEVERMLNGTTVVLCTLCMLSNPALDQVKMWDVLPPEKLVVDEGSQINVFEFMHIFHKFRDLKKVCFFGDPKQLPPYMKETVTAIQSIFDVPHLQPSAFFLNTQYRMPVPLGEFISREMYRSKLKSEHLITTPSCVAFVDVAKGKEEHRGKSWVNIEEVHMVVTLVRDYYHHKDYCVITPYDAQRTEIQRALERARLPSDKVFNVDSFQGHEADFIIVSAVRTANPGFLAFDCRTNVMLSRCKSGMVIVTNLIFAQRARRTLIGRLSAQWSRLPGLHTTWIDWRLVLANTVDLPGVPAPRSVPTLTRALLPAPASSSSTQRTPEASTSSLHDRMAHLSIETHDIAAPSSWRAARRGRW